MYVNFVCEFTGLAYLFLHISFPRYLWLKQMK